MKYQILCISTTTPKDASKRPRDVVYAHAFQVDNMQPAQWWLPEGRGKALFSHGEGVYDIELIASGRDMVPATAAFIGEPALV